MASIYENITNRGIAFLEDIAGTVGSDGDKACDMLNEICSDGADWGCILAALKSHNPEDANVKAAIASIQKAAVDYCASWEGN